MSSIDFMSNKYEDKQTKVEALDTERQTGHTYILTLENKQEIKERRTQESNLEIRNFPKIPKNPESRKTKQDLVSLIKDMVNSLNIPLKKSDICDVFRIN